MATREALNGTPLSKIVWVPPSTVTENPKGYFIVEYAPKYTPSMRTAWDE